MARPSLAKASRVDTVTINVQIRKDARVTYTAEMVLAVLKAREQDEDINIIIYPGGTAEVVATE